MSKQRLSILVLALNAVSGVRSSEAQSTFPTTPTTVRASGPASDHVPVLYVHGVGADLLDLWTRSREYLLAHGYTKGDITDFHYASLDGTAQGAEQLAREVDWLLEKTGKSKVDIISHSFGGLVTKLCVVEGGCKGKVAHWESLAGANNGTNLKLDSFGLSGASLADAPPDSPLVSRLQASAAAEIAAQKVLVQVQWTPSDQSIVPPTLSKEVWAENVELPATINHQTILWDDAVIARTYEFLQRPAASADSAGVVKDDAQRPAAAAQDAADAVP